jgi:hypothetical protein
MFEGLCRGVYTHVGMPLGMWCRNERRDDDGGGVSHEEECNGGVVGVRGGRMDEEGIMILCERIEQTAGSGDEASSDKNANV